MINNGFPLAHSLRHTCHLPPSTSAPRAGDKQGVDVMPHIDTERAALPLIKDNWLRNTISRHSSQMITPLQYIAPFQMVGAPLICSVAPIIKSDDHQLLTKGQEARKTT